jgi:MFS family permease
MGSALSNLMTPRQLLLERKASLQKSLYLTTWECLIAKPIVTIALPINLFVTALVTKVYPLSNPMIGLFSALPFVANFLQLAALPFLSRFKSSKKLTIGFAGLNALSWLWLAIILPHIPRHDPNVAGLWLCSWFLISSIFWALCSVTWNSWIQEWFPLVIRGKYFGFRNALGQFGTVIFMLAVGYMLYKWDYSVGIFQIIIYIAVFFRIISMILQMATTAKPHRHAVVQISDFNEQITSLKKSRSYLTFTVSGIIFFFAAYCFGPFYQVFMTEHLGLSGWDLGVVNTLTQLGGVLSLPAWGRLIDRHGNKSVMVFSLVLWQLQNFAWCILVPHNRWLLYPMWTFGGVASAGFLLGQFTLLLKLIPANAKDLAIGFNLAVTSLVAAIAPVIGGFLINYMQNKTHDVYFVFHTCFLVQPIFAIISALVLLSVDEKAASPLSDVVDAMRDLRTLSGVLGLSFFVETVFFRKKAE